MQVIKYHEDDEERKGEMTGRGCVRTMMATHGLILPVLYL